MDRSIVEKERTHGSSIFPLGVYDNYELYPEYSKQLLYLHWHDETELLYIRKGAALVQIDERESVVREGEAAFVPSGAIHTAMVANSKEFWFNAVVFNLNFLTSGISDVIQLQYIDRIKMRGLQLPLFIGKRAAWERRIIDELVFLFAASRRKSPGYELAIKGSLFKVFSELVSQGADAPATSQRIRQDLDRLKLVIQYIHANYAQKLSLDDMAALSNLSKYYFCRFFKSCIGKSPVDYLHFYRLLKAEELLKETNLKVVDIAFDVGFNDLSHFTRLFHKQTGVTPSQFRNRKKTAISSEL
jgi:AraC-like DNA-binding protein